MGGGTRTYQRSQGTPHPVEGSADTWHSVTWSCPLCAEHCYPSMASLTATQHMHAVVECNKGILLEPLFCNDKLPVIAVEFGGKKMSGKILNIYSFLYSRQNYKFSTFVVLPTINEYLLRKYYPLKSACYGLSKVIEICHFTSKRVETDFI